MSSGEYCAGILAHIKEHLPKDHDQVAEYLIDMEHHYSTHPCQRDVSSLLAMLAIHTFSTNEFTEIVSRAIHPDTLVTAVLETIKTLLDNRDLDGANATFSFILAYADRPDKREEKYVAFRDFIEYAYYMTYCAPKHLPPVHPYLNTDILLQYARLCALSGDIEKAETFFLALQNASPINDAILFERADIARQQGKFNEYREITLKCLEYAWMPEDLARAYRNMGYYCTMTSDYTGAVTCYLMATTWEESKEVAREIEYITEIAPEKPDISFILTHGQEILHGRGIPFGPNTQMIDLMIQYADECKAEGDLFEARKYLSRAKALEISDRLEREIERIERFIEDNTMF